MSHETVIGESGKKKNCALLATVMLRYYYPLYQNDSIDAADKAKEEKNKTPRFLIFVNDVLPCGDRKLTRGECLTFPRP